MAKTPREGTPKRKLAIVGFAPSKAEAPFGNPEWEVWCLNNAYTFVDMAMADRWFDVHSDFILSSDIRRGPDHLERMAAFAALPGKQVILKWQSARVPGSVAFPYDEVVRVCGAYMTSSISWMLGLGITEGYQEIGIWGVDMATNTEWADQRPGCEYLIGFARGLGRTVYVPESCQLLKGKSYGLGDLNPGGEHITFPQFKSRLDVLHLKEKECQKEEERLMTFLYQMDGSKREVEMWKDHGMVPIGTYSERIQHIKTEEEKIKRQLADVRGSRAAYNGSIMECRHWITMTPDGADQAQLLEAVNAGTFHQPETVNGAPTVDVQIVTEPAIEEVAGVPV